MSHRFGILLPITSRGADCNEFWPRFERFCQTFSDTTREDSGREHVKIFVGLDDDDPVLGVKKKGRERLLARISDSTAGIVVAVSTSGFERGAICHYWTYLAKIAYDKGCDYFVLLGDDVQLHTPRWMELIVAQFQVLANKLGVPSGFGCVSFTDVTFASFPTFPVVGRIHMDIFEGQLLPSVFVNQHGDPYLFQLYRRWGASVMLKEVLISNSVGGCLEGRYEKSPPDENWTGEVLSEGVHKVVQHLKKGSVSVSKRIVLDVIIPSFRCDPTYIRRILALSKPTNCEVGFIIIVDKPYDPLVNLLEEEFSRDPFFRIRCQKQNTGAPSARNRGLRESAADYVLFLDDDVVPDEDILWRYAEAIQKYPAAKGFAGPTLLPGEPTVWAVGVRLAGVLFFWDLPIKQTWHRNYVPWAVTANVLVKRNPNIFFDEVYPKTGGGEDIDYCLKCCDGRLVCVPEAYAIHPWWHEGSPPLKRFFGWANGDGILTSRFPKFTYIALPNFSEVALMLMVYVLVVGIPFRDVFILIPSLIMGEFVHEFYFHFLRRREHLHISGLKRVYGTMWSCVVRNASEFGRMWCQIRFCRPWLILHRFDWFVGMLPEAIHEERKTALHRVVAWCLTGATFYTLFRN